MIQQFRPEPFGPEPHHFFYDLEGFFLTYTLTPTGVANFATELVNQGYDVRKVRDELVVVCHYTNELRYDCISHIALRHYSKS